MVERKQIGTTCIEISSNRSSLPRHRPLIAFTKQQAPSFLPKDRRSRRSRYTKNGPIDYTFLCEFRGEQVTCGSRLQSPMFSPGGKRDY